MKIESGDVTALVLAGGQARRMGGQDKGLVELQGKPMIQHIVEQISSQCGALVINANRNHEQYEKPGYPVISDELEDYQGPLAGMLAGLKAVQTRWMITLPTDGPFVESNYVEKMTGAIESSGNQIAVAQGQDRLQPVYVLLDRNLAPKLEDYLANGERKIDRWYDTVGYTSVPWPDTSKMFINVNSPDDLDAAESLLDQKSGL